MDFAGGTAVHITSGTTVATFALFYECETKNYPDVAARFWSIISGRIQSLWRFILCRPHLKEIPGNSIDKRQSVDGDPPGDIILRELPRPATNETHPNNERVLDSAEVPKEPASELSGFADTSPHNVNNMVLGTALIWIGWFGFNGGSALGGNLRAVSACISTHVAACSGGCASLLIGYMLNGMAEKFPGTGADAKSAGKPSVIAFCDGVVVGLVAITPAAGYVSTSSPLDVNSVADGSRFPFGALQSSVWLPPLPL
jgi:Amt family ammonium transporter